MFNRVVNNIFKTITVAVMISAPYISPQSNVFYVTCCAPGVVIWMFESSKSESDNYHVAI
ncbi:MAG: hypothetical protein ACTSU6_01185 [Candidatus Njordarchaeales archaeon]